MAKNYYIILGIPSDASQNQIKQAYRRRVKELHPDYYGKNSGPFREIQEAYTVLRDPEQRTSYDRRHQMKTAQYPESEIIIEETSPSGSPIVPVEPVRRSPVEEVYLTRSFETYTPSITEIFDRMNRNFFTSKQTKSEHIEPLSIEITLTPDEAARGGQVEVLLPVHATCQACAGNGSIDFFICWRCGGHGVLDTDVPIQVSYPAGIVDRHVVQIPLDRLGINNFYLSVFFRVQNRCD